MEGIFFKAFPSGCEELMLKVSKCYFSFCPLCAHAKVICLSPAEGVPVTDRKA